MPFARLDRATTPTAHIGLGLAAVGRPGYITPHRDRDLPDGRGVDALRERTHELLDAAYAQGVRYVDTARSYGRAEAFLADWLAARPEATDVVVGSKWGYTYTGDWNTEAETHEVKDHSLAAFERQHAESAGLLGDRLDLYQIHSVTPDSPTLTDTALHGRLAQLAEQGVTVGVSTSGPAQADAIRAALAVTVDGSPSSVPSRPPTTPWRPRPGRRWRRPMTPASPSWSRRPWPTGVSPAPRRPPSSGRSPPTRAWSRTPSPWRWCSASPGRVSSCPERSPWPSSPAISTPPPRPRRGAPGPAERPGGGTRGLLALPLPAALDLTAFRTAGVPDRPTRATGQERRSARGVHSLASAARARTRPGRATPAGPRRRPARGMETR